MRRSKLISVLHFILLCTFIPTSLFAQVFWDSSQAQLTIRRINGVGFTLNGEVYIVGGTVYPNVNTGSLQKYNEENDVWIDLADMPTPRHVFGGGVIKGKFYAVGGLNTLNNVEEFDSDSNSWDTEKELMPTGRGHIATAVFRDSLLFVFGGLGNNPKVEAYDAVNDRWYTHYENNPFPSHTAGAVEINDKLYVFGGGVVNTSNSEKTLEFDPISNRWSRKADMPIPASGMAYGVVDNKIYVMGGFSFDPFFNDTILSPHIIDLIVQSRTGRSAGIMRQ